MDHDLFIVLLNPAISLVLAAGFLCLWLYRRSAPYLIRLALGYALTAAGFMLQRFELPTGMVPTRLMSVACFSVATYSVAVAVCEARGRRPPRSLLAAVLGCGYAVFVWFMLVDPELTARVYAVNFAFGAVGFLVAADLRSMQDKTLIDRLVIAAALLIGLNFVLRTIVIVAANGGVLVDEGFHTSIYWTTTMLTHASLSLALALTVLAGTVMEIVGEAEARSCVDPLSGLLNRRGLSERIADQGADLAQATIIMADLDHFKSINDRYGHQTGDAVIAAFARVLRVSAGKGALVARTGGEEFTVVLPGTPMAAGRAVAEAVRAALASPGIGTEARIAGPVTCSFGVTERCVGETVDAAMDRADHAMMRAKAAGRDRVRLVHVRPPTMAPVPAPRVTAA